VAHYGRTRFRKLDQIIPATSRISVGVSYSSTRARRRGGDSIVGGRLMYVTSPWSVVHGIDARTGKGLWPFDPGWRARKATEVCCDVVNGAGAPQRQGLRGCYDGR